MTDDAEQEAFDRRVLEALRLVEPPATHEGWSVEANEALVSRYLYAYTGRWFDTLGEPAVRVGDQITAEDLVAVQMLAVTVPARTSIRLLVGDLRDPVADLLGQIPTNVDLWRADDALIGRGSAAWMLWDLLDGLPGIGWVTANKLLARKRPRLLPVYDSVVRDALEPGPDQFWSRLRACLADHEQVRAELQRVRAIGASDLSLLRILDIIVWMRAFGHDQPVEERVQS